MKKWLTGRKTYLGAILVVAIAAGLVFFHRLTPQVALAVALFALSLFAATFRAALQRHHDEAMEVLSEVAIAGAAVAARNVSGAMSAGAAAFEDGAKLDSEIKAEDVAEVKA